MRIHLFKKKLWWAFSNTAHDYTRFEDFFRNRFNLTKQKYNEIKQQQQALTQREDAPLAAPDKNWTYGPEWCSVDQDPDDLIAAYQGARGLKWAPISKHPDEKIFKDRQQAAIQTIRQSKSAAHNGSREY